ncbi:eamA-like transporter family protein [Pseudomonas aeruginosa]|nr:eamA-like transporter family protein [Pseudomonas aeruginosa]
MAAPGADRGAGLRGLHRADRQGHRTRRLTGRGGADGRPVAAAGGLAGAGPAGQRTRPGQWPGIALGVAGVLWAGHAALALGRAPGWAYGLPLLGMLALALATLLQKRWDDAPGSLAVVLFVQIGAALPAFAGLALAEGSLRPPLSGGFLFGLAWLVLLPTFGGYGLYWLGLRHLSAQGGSAALYLSPALTLLWAHWMFAEPLTPMLLGGLLLSLAGLGWLYRAERR